MPFLATQTASPTHFLWTALYCTNNAPTTPWLMSRLQPVTTEQVRPKFLPTDYSNTPYSTLLTHDLPTYLTIHSHMTLSTSHTNDGTIYCPPWPPPHNLSGYPAFSHSVDPKPGHFWLTNHDQSGHLRCLNTQPSRPVPQKPYCLDHRQPQSPPPYCTRSLHFLPLPTLLIVPGTWGCDHHIDITTDAQWHAVTFYIGQDDLPNAIHVPHSPTMTYMCHTVLARDPASMSIPTPISAWPQNLSTSLICNQT